MSDYKKKSKLGAEALKCITDWMTEYNIKWRHATPEEQAHEIDIVAKKSYEVKHQTYPDSICLEEISIRMPGKSDVPGWMYTSKADYLINVAPDRKSFLKINMQELKNVYIKIKRNYTLIWDSTDNGLRGDKWESAHRVIKVGTLEGYVKIIKVEV